MLIPAIDLIDGQVVRLYQGDYEQKTEYAKNPIELATYYSEMGAKCLHIVDLTGAKDTSKRQLELISNMVKSSDMIFQAGGGVRNEADVQGLLSAGVDRVVIGSLAAKQPELVKQWIATYGADAIVLALDVNINANGQKMIATHGWQEDSGIELEPLLHGFVEAGAKHVLCTDISKDGTLQGANKGLYESMVELFPTISWQASGGIGSLDDIAQLKPTGVQNVILGRALLEGKFTLDTAFDVWGK